MHDNFIEVHHTSNSSPVRRVALGDHRLDSAGHNPPGALMLGGIVASLISGVNEATRADLSALYLDLLAGRAISQPRVRFRFQNDRHGLKTSRHSLDMSANSLNLQVDQGAFDHPVPSILGALYGFGSLSSRSRKNYAPLIRKSLSRTEPFSENDVLQWIQDEPQKSSFEISHSCRWALMTMGFDTVSIPSRSEVTAQFRTQLRLLHPDALVGTDNSMELDHAKLVTDLTQARDYLLAELRPKG